MCDYKDMHVFVWGTNLHFMFSVLLWALVLVEVNIINVWQTNSYIILIVCLTLMERENNTGLQQ